MFAYILHCVFVNNSIQGAIQPLVLVDEPKGDSQNVYSYRQKDRMICKQENSKEKKVVQ